MSIVCNNECKEIVKQSLEKSVGYDNYVNMVEHYVKTNSTSGDNKSEELIKVTKLNEHRVKRWNKTLKVNDEILDRVSRFNKQITWLVITESWCGDAAHVLPVINKVASLKSNINMRVVFRDENPILMDNFLTNGSRSIPLLIMIDDAKGEVLKTYGSRPEILTNMVREYKEMHGVLSSEFKEEMQKWYNKDKGQTIMEELTELL